MDLINKTNRELKFSIRLLTECFIFILIITSFAFQIPEKNTLQSNLDTTIKNIDSVRIKKFNSDSVRKYFKASDTLISYQLNKIEEYTLTINNINSKLRRGFDNTIISTGLSESDSIIYIVKNNYTNYRGQTSLKILSATKNLLLQLHKNLTDWQNVLTNYNSELNSKREQLNKISTDTNLLVMPEDSVLFLEYLKKLKPLGEKTTTADSIIVLQLKSLGVLQNSVSSNYLEVSDLLEEVDFQINNINTRIMEKEFNYIWENESDSLNQTKFNDVVQKSFIESKLLMKIYLESNWISRIIVILLGILFYFVLKKNILLIKKENKDSQIVLSKANHIPGHLITSTVVFCLMLIPLIYSSAPQAFTQSLWGIQIIALGILLRNKLNITAGIQLLILLLLFYLTGFTNLLIESTSAERWIQFIISSVSILLGIWLFREKKENYFSNIKFERQIIILFILMNVSALIFNIFGRVTLAKVLNTGSTYGMIEAINLLVFVEIIIDAVYIIMEASKKSSRLTAFFEYKGLEIRLRKILGIIAAIVWMILFTKNLHIYDFIFGGISEFLSAEHQLGNLKFSFGSIAIFVLVIWISTLISQMVAFIFSGPKTNNSGETKNNLGSTVLLIRLAILALGVLLAFGASGIPMDKMAIILGALGVGIGFGLQGLVNNLVSGIVIAFEKPIQIGDVIEVGTRNGTVKEIGLRSSSIITFDGSEVIVPNGDIISQHLVNWTKDSSYRRIEIPVGVAYGSDIKKVKEVILQVFSNNDAVLNFPEPMIRVLDFGDNSVDMKIYFWSEVLDWIDVKSDVMSDVYNSLNEAGIEIPYPQRDLHIRTIDKDVISELNKTGEDNSDQKK
ncbi:MAG: mechanosensitive ion channel domain-containing protein [Ignavibacteria bacterium]